MRETAVRGFCPFCFGKTIRAIDPFGDEKPMHGDYCCCQRCGEFAVFDFTKRSNRLRKPTRHEQIEIAKNPSAKAVYARYLTKQQETAVLQ